MQKYNGFDVDKRGQVYIYYFHAIDRATVDEWYVVDGNQTREAATTTNHAMRVWVFQKLLFPTPYLSTKADQAVKDTPPELYESNALVISHPVAFRTMSLFLTRILSKRDRTEFRIFRSVEDAVRWLETRRVAIDSSAKS